MGLKEEICFERKTLNEGYMDQTLEKVDVWRIHL